MAVLMKTARYSDIPGLRVCCALGQDLTLKRHEEGRKTGIAQRRKGPVESTPKSSFPSFASVQKSGLYQAPPAMQRGANTF
jgi:hypothetical protein